MVLLGSQGVSAAGEYEQSLRLAAQKRFDEAFALVLPLAQRGERKAQYIIGESYYWGTGVAQDRKMAVSAGHDQRGLAAHGGQ